jgi:hypothetical protein
MALRLKKAKSKDAANSARTPVSRSRTGRGNPARGSPWLPLWMMRLVLTRLPVTAVSPACCRAPQRRGRKRGGRGCGPALSSRVSGQYCQKVSPRTRSPGATPGVKAPPNPTETRSSGRRRPTKLSPARRAAAAPIPDRASTAPPVSHSQTGSPRSRRALAWTRRKKGRTSSGSAANMRIRPALAAPRPADVRDIRIS